MTIYFITPTGSYTDAITFSIDVPNVTGDCVLNLTSRYNKETESLDLTTVLTNDRYTEFSTDYTDELGDYDFSGLWNYEITDGVNPIQSGIVKIVNNKTKSLQNKDKYVSPNDSGDAYVIYN